MADVTATLTLDKDTYVHGETITATYDVAGVDELTTVGFDGVITVNGVEHAVHADAQVGDQVAFAPPTALGIEFTSTADPRVFTAVA